MLLQLRFLNPKPNAWRTTAFKNAYFVSTEQRLAAFVLVYQRTNLEVFLIEQETGWLTTIEIGCSLATATVLPLAGHIECVTSQLTLCILFSRSSPVGT